MGIVELAAVAIIFFVIYKVHQDNEAKREEERHRKAAENRRKEMFEKEMREAESKAMDDISRLGPY